MRSLMTIFLLTASLLAASADTSALTASEYNENKTNKKKWPITQIYLNGVGVGASLAASVLIQQGRPPLFCQPEEIVLKDKNYIKLIDALLAKNEIPDETQVEMVLLLALITAFPCQ
jgi:hypothetical protein